MIAMVEHTGPEPERIGRLELVYPGLLVGGMPCKGKSVPPDLVAAHGALTAEQADTDRRSVDEQAEED